MQQLLLDLLPNSSIDAWATGQVMSIFGTGLGSPRVHGGGGGTLVSGALSFPVAKLTHL